MLKTSARNISQHLPTPPARSQPAARCQPRSAPLWLQQLSVTRRGKALSSSYRQQSGKQEHHGLTSGAHLPQRGRSSFCSFPSRWLQDAPCKSRKASAERHERKVVAAAAMRREIRAACAKFRRDGVQHCYRQWNTEIYLCLFCKRWCEKCTNGQQ